MTKPPERSMQIKQRKIEKVKTTSNLCLLKMISILLLSILFVNLLRKELNIYFIATLLSKLHYESLI